MGKSFLLTAVIVLVAGCGRSDVTSRPSNHRGALTRELQGRWSTLCTNKAVHTVIFAEKSLVLERVTYGDVECQIPEQTTRMPGEAKLANNYKEGVNNSIVLRLANEIKLTYHTLTGASAQENQLITARKATEGEFGPRMTAAEIKNQERENLKIRQVKELTPWKAGEEKTLNKLQYEKLAGSLNARPVGELGNQVAFKYEVDNNVLQLAGPGDFAGVYLKQ